MIGVPGTDFAFPLADLKGVRLAVATSDKDIRKNTCAHLRDVINMDLRKEDDEDATGMKTPNGEQLMTLSSIMALNARSQRDSAIGSVRTDHIEAVRKDSVRLREGATANETLISALGLLKGDNGCDEETGEERLHERSEMSKRRTSKSVNTDDSIELTTFNRSNSFREPQFNYADI